MISLRKLCYGAAMVLSLTTVRADYAVLHHFMGSAGDAGNPSGGLLLDGLSLYGITSVGGVSNRGVIFRIGLDGSGFTNLHSFVGGNNDGSTPRGSLILVEGTLYGMTYAGGTNDLGTVFSITTNGASFKLLRSFNGGISDGRNPSGSLLRIGAHVFGCTDAGGGSGFGYGTLFRVQTNGASHTILHKFTGTGSDGGWPGEALIVAGNILYGGTEIGGSTGNGIVFQMNTNGSSFQLLHSFTGTDGVSSKGALTRAGSTLYGTTVIGGTSNAGSVFGLETNGTSFAVLHHFAGPPTDGLRSYRQLQLLGLTLYGASFGGGNSASGTVFQVNTNGTSPVVLHHFSGGTNDGCNPLGALTVAGATFYGMTWAGGTNNLGVIFAVTPVPPAISTVSPLPTGTAGDPYAITIIATNGVPPYSWAIAANDLPTGLLLEASTGAITGTPSVATLTNFTIQVTGADGRSSTKDFSLTINPTAFEMWQLAYFGCTNCLQAAAQADPLGKGISNFDQYRIGLNPTNAASLFQILSVAQTSNDLSVTWQSVGGCTNLLEAALDLAGTYTNASPNIIIAGSGETITNYLDIGSATNGPTRFYRVRFVP